LVKFSVLSKYFEKIDNTSSRLEITSILFDLFSITDKTEIQSLIYFCQGNIGPNYLSKDISIGQSTLISLISQYTAIPEKEIKEDFLDKGDLGLVIEKSEFKKKQSTLFTRDLDFLEVFNIFKKISEIEGKGAIDEKQKLLKSVLFNLDSTSAKYIIRFPIGFRLGFSDSTIIDALACFGKENIKEYKQLITEKYQLVSDLGLLAKIIFEKGIEKIKNLKITPFTPIKSQLCERSKNLEEIKERLGTFAIDTKVDGFRQQIHKVGNKVKIFSRQEEDITDMFPDVVENVKKIDHDFIIDCEAIAYDSENQKYHSFQITITRKRKYDILEKSKELPLHLKVFDCLYLDEKEIYGLPFIERRKIVEEYFNINDFVKATEIKITDDVNILEEMFLDRLALGFEGVICKDLNQPYKAGSRGYSWIKFKKSYKGNLDTIDAVILGYDSGQGKRTELGIGALLVGIYDAETDKYYTIAKVGTGLSDDVIRELYERLEKKKLIKKPEYIVSNIVVDNFVVPEIVVEINFDEITKSPIHTLKLDSNSLQGIALRFPRLVKIRMDRSNKETTNKKEIEKISTV
jgi:DNA ligase-1